MASYSGTVKDVYYNGAVKINIQGGPCGGDQILGRDLVKSLTAPGVILAEGDQIVVRVIDDRLTAVDKKIVCGECGKAVRDEIRCSECGRTLNPPD